jgi:signal-transduction protein with cAMP-binding, CBS, and nucleotidyltransferase domain
MQQIENQQNRYHILLQNYIPMIEQLLSSDDVETIIYKNTVKDIRAKFDKFADFVIKELDKIKSTCPCKMCNSASEYTLNVSKPYEIK